MNERIWQLQGQAKVLAEEIVSQRKYDDYMEYKQSLMDQTMNKFAELIVRECIQVISNTDTRQSFTTYDLGLVQATMVKIQNNVKKHFKPEE